MLDDILQRVVRVASTVASVESGVVDREGRWPEKTMRTLQEEGLGGLVIPKSAGGLGAGLLGLARACEILGREDGSSALCFGMHSVASAVLSARATRDQKERYLDRICRGAHISTLALSEPGTGSHFWFPRARYEAVGDEFVIEGSKVFVTNSVHADSLVVTVAGSSGFAPGHFSCMVVDGDAEGLEWGPEWNGLGMRGNAARRVDLTGVRVPRGNLLGAEGDEIWFVFEVIAPFFLVAMSGTYLGIAEGALSSVVADLRSRRYEHSGASPSEEAVVQHKVGELHAMVERTRRLLYFAASSGDSGEPEALAAICSAKAEADQCVVEVTNEAMTLAGGRAYRENDVLARRLRDARAAKVMAPTTDILRTWVGRISLGHPILGG